MPDQNGEKSQEATPHRRQKAREEGSVARSQDLGSAALLLAGLGVLWMSAGALNVLLLANPTDVYRLFNLTGFANVSLFAGMSGLAGQVRLAPAVLAACLAAWVVVPLGGAVLLFNRREL